RPSEVRDFESYWTLTMMKLRTNDKTVTTLVDAQAFRETGGYEQARRMMGDRLVAGTPDEVAGELSRLALAAQADELMVVTPAPAHGARIRSSELLAAAFALRAAA